MSAPELKPHELLDMVRRDVWPTLSNAALADQLGLQPETVAAYRRRRKLPRYDRGTPARDKLEAVTPEQWATTTDAELARDLGISSSTVNVYRRDHDLPRPNNDKSDYSHIDWAALDWTRPTEELRREIGCSHAVLHRHRHRLGHPPPPRRERPRLTTRPSRAHRDADPPEHNRTENQSAKAAERARTNPTVIRLGPGKLARQLERALATHPDLIEALAEVTLDPGRVHLGLLGHWSNHR